MLSPMSPTQHAPKTSWIALLFVASFAVGLPLQAEPDWFLSPHGANDRLGAINHLSNDAVRKAPTPRTWRLCAVLVSKARPFSPTSGSSR